MTNWWAYKSARVPPRAPRVSIRPQPPEEQDEGGHWYEKGLKIATSPLREAGGFALGKIAEYSRKFVTPTTAWAVENIMEFDEKTGSYKLMLGKLDNPIDFLRSPIERHERTLFGNKIKDTTAVNPLRAYAGHDDEMDRAEQYMTQFDPLTRFTLETVFDPTVILTTGSSIGAKSLIKMGAQNLAKGESGLAAVEGLLNQRRTLKTLFGEHDDLLRWLREHPGDPMAKSMLGAGAILNVMNGLPEVMLDSFFKLGAKPISKFPTLHMTITETENGLRLRPILGKMADQSPRSKVEMSVQGAHQLIENTKRAVLRESPDLYDMQEVNQKVLQRIADPATDFSDIGGFAEETHKVIHEQNVYLQDLIERASPLTNDHAAYIEKDLQERVAEAFMKKYNIAGKTLSKDEIKLFGKQAGMEEETIDILTKTGAKDVDMLPGWQKVAAKALNVERGHKFFRNKLAATWMSGVLMSPYYLVQNLITDPLFSGFRYMSSPEQFRLEFARAPHTVINHLANRGGLARRLEFTGQDIDDIYKMMRDGEIFGHEIGQMGQGMSNAQHFLKTSNKYTSGGIIMDAYDKILGYARRTGIIGDDTRNLLHGLPLIPHQGAAMVDDKSWLGIYSNAIKKKYNESLALHRNPQISAMVPESEQIIQDLIDMGVPAAKANTVGLRYLTSSSPEEFIEGARAISGINPADLLSIDHYSDNLLFSRDISKRITNAVKNHYGFTREQLISGRTVLEGGVEKRIEGLDEIFRNGVREEQINTMNWTKDAFPQMIDRLVDDASLTPAIGDFIKSINHVHTDIFDRLHDYGIKALGSKKVTSRDVRVWGDINLRNTNARQQLAHLIHDATIGAQEGSFRIAYKRRDLASIAVRKAGDDVSSLMDNFSKARSEALFDRTGSRKAWGDFRSKYDLDNVLPESPDVDALDNFIKTKQDEVWSNHFDDTRSILGIQGNAMRWENRTFEGLHDNLQRYTRDVMELADNAAAHENTIMHYVTNMDELPHSNLEIGAELQALQDKASRYGVDIANEQMGNFYSGMTSLDETLAWALPFARFGVRVATTGPRTMARYPGMASAFYRWQHGSEKIPAPVPSWMPLVGNLWFNPMGAMAPYQQFKGITDERVFGEDFGQQIQSNLGAMGFNPNPLLIGASNLLGNEEGSGTLFPMQKAIRGGTLLPDPLSAPFEGGDIIMNKIRAALYGGSEEDTQLTREIEKQLVDNGLNPATTPKGSDEWNNAKREVIARQAFDYGVGNTIREFPKERVELAKAETKALVAAGISNEMQVALRRQGKSAYSLLNSEQKEKVIAAIGEENFQNRASITPIGLNAKERNQWHSIQVYYAVRHISEQQKDENIKAIGQDLLDGKISGQVYRDKIRDENQNHFIVIESQKRSILSEIHGDDVLDVDKFDSNKIDELFERMRLDIKRASGRELTSTRLPEDEALDQYRSIIPTNYMDTITGDIDWTKWDNARQSFLVSQPLDIQSYIDKIEERRKTRDPVEAKFEEAKAQYEEQQLIPRYKGISPSEQQIALDGIKLLRGLTDRGKTRSEALVLIQQASPRMAILTRIALKNPNPAYKKYRERHPLLQIFFSDSAVPSDILPTQL